MNSLLPTSETDCIASDAVGNRVFVPLVEVAATLELAPTTVRRWVWSGEVFKRERGRGRGFDIDVLTLPPKHRARFLAKTAKPLRLVGSSATKVSQDGRPTYTDARHSVRQRAEFRLEAVLSLAKVRDARQKDETLAEVERRWLRNFRRAHARAKVSIRSARSWTVAYEAAGIDGLVDGNDGQKLRGSRIPAPARQLFKDLYLRPHRPNLRLCYRDVVKAAVVNGWGEMPSYDTFRRFAKSIPRMVRLLHRDHADTPRAVLPYVIRDPNSIPAMHTWQSDHRHIDVPVRCDQGCAVCTGKKPKGHFPIWTAFIDIRSRRVLASEISIEAPDSDRVLSVFRRGVELEGLPSRVYLDNGADYRKAFGRRLRKKGKEQWDGPNEEQMQSRFAPLGIQVTYAIPYNAQAKPIERMFRTFRHRFDEAFDAYRGQRGDWNEVASELFYRPHELPSVSEFAYLLQLAIEEYNSVTPHTGRAMDGQTPDAVFDATRLPRRDPDRAFALLFFETVKGGRIVGRDGVQYDGRLYRLSAVEKQLAYFGERVDVRINPNDQRSAILLDMKTGAYVCDAIADEEHATYDTTDKITRERIERMKRDERELKRMAPVHVDGAKERLAEHRGTLLQYHREHIRPKVETNAVESEATKGANVRVFVPALSSVMREVEENASTSMCAEPASDASALCLVSRPRQKRGKKKATLRQRRNGTTSWNMIAAQLGVSHASLARYRKGQSPWPEGMEQQFQVLAANRANPAEANKVVTAKPVRGYARGGRSWLSIARELGTSHASLARYRSGQAPWPQGMKERFERLAAQRTN